MQAHCPLTWVSAVDAIITSGLAFHGYTTIDPAKLRKDEAHRTETTNDPQSTTTTSTDATTKLIGVTGIIPVATYTTTKGTTVVVHESHEKTVVLEGATLEDLALPDRVALTAAAGAGSVLTSRIIVGANWSVWSTDQRVEVMVELGSAADGSMRWSARCSALRRLPSASSAIEAAAHCVADALSAPPR